MLAQSQYTYDLGDYRMGIEIGRGSFATVYKGVSVKSGSPVAIKNVLKARLDKRLLENLESEIAILKSVKHPHVVSLLDFRETSSNFYIFMEYCSLGDLSFFVRKKQEISNTLPLVASLFERYPSPSGQGLNEVLARHFLIQLVSALQFMRQHNLVHRDIKPQNLLLCPPRHSEQEFLELGYKGRWELPILKVADFGFARFLPNTDVAETLCGSPLYMAPEILKMEKYDAKADLWSVGAVVYEMMTGRPPFHTKTNLQKVLLEKIEAANDVIAFPRNNHTSPEMRAFIRALLKKNATERMSYNELFNHPLVVETIVSTEDNKPLDQSKLDENLFISEYIQAIPANHRGTSNGQQQNDQQSIAVAHLRNQRERDAAQAQASSNRANSANTAVVAKSNTSSPSPGSSFLVHGGQVTSSKNASNHNQAITRHNINNNNLRASRNLEQEYVMVEKRTVEVNALADELARSPMGITHGGSGGGNGGASGTGTRRNSSPTAGLLQNSPINARRLSIGYGTSPTNALGRALSMASARLFGTRVESSGSTTAIAPPQFVQISIPTSIDSEERKLIKELESLATKAKVVNLYAEVKFSQLKPLNQQAAAPAADSPQSLRPRTDSSSSTSTAGSPYTGIMDDNGLLMEDSQKIAEEALVLYVKTLSLLTAAMDKASRWWSSNDRSVASNRLNDIIQWIRDRFNESLERAEYAQMKLDKCRLASQSNANKNEHTISTVATTTSFNNPSDAGPITAEKLIFDRAMEMSRQAAVDELLNQELPVCEVSYGTAVWMLEAILETDGQEELLSSDDRAIVESFITHISHRLSILRKKLENTDSHVSCQIRQDQSRGGPEEE